MDGYAQRAIFMALLTLTILAVFAAFALLGPEDPCTNAVDFCDAAR